jgi:hypothetical protein
MTNNNFRLAVLFCVSAIMWMLILLAVAATDMPGSAVAWNILAVSMVSDTEPKPVYGILAWVVIAVICLQSGLLNAWCARRNEK